MKISPNALEWLIELEGFEPRAYKDVAGLLTIGVGHLLTKDEISSGKINIKGKPVHYENGLSVIDAQSLLSQDLDHFENAVNAYVEVPLTQNQFDTLVSFSFNVGISAFKNSTLLKRLNARRYNDIPAQLRRWKYANSKVIQGLINRREDEIQRWSAN